MRLATLTNGLACSVAQVINVTSKVPLRVLDCCLMQVLKSKERPLVSSIFFMCLPDKVSHLCLLPAMFAWYVYKHYMYICKIPEHV